MTAQQTSQDVEPRVAALVAALREAGAIRSPEWANAFGAVPRHVFVPEIFQQETDERGIAVWRPLDSSDRDRWLDAVYTDQTLVTALDPATAKATGDGALTGVATSSSTLPSLMAAMLEDLHITPGMAVCEIGTGTGWNTGLLCHRLGDRDVYSTDVDPSLTRTARDRLAALGHHPRLATGDGRAALPSTAAFDRIIATCSLRTIPTCWLHRTKPGGVILTDLYTGIEGGLVRLTVTGHGHAEGRFTPTTGRFMPARSGPDSYTVTTRPTYTPTSGTRQTTVTAGDIRASYAFRLLLGFSNPDLELVYHLDDATMALQLQQHDGGSWARTPLPGHPGEGTVTWGGGTNLWDRVEQTWHWWTSRGRPGHTHLGITATPETITPWWQEEDGGRRIGLDTLAKR